MPPKKRKKTEAEVAAELGIGETTAHRYLQRGMPAEGPERDAWLSQHASAGDRELAELRKAKLAAEVLRTKRMAELAEAKVAQMARQFVRRSTVKKAIASHITDARLVLEAIVQEVRALLPPGRQSEMIVGEVEHSVARALACLAESARTVDDLEPES